MVYPWSRVDKMLLVSMTYTHRRRLYPQYPDKCLLPHLLYIFLITLYIHPITLLLYIYILYYYYIYLRVLRVLKGIEYKISNLQYPLCVGKQRVNNG